MEEKKLEELTINELKELAESDGIKVTTTKKADIIEEINKAREVDTTDNVENNQNDAEIKEGWAVTQEVDGKVHVRPTENGEIIDTPVEKVIKADGTVEDIEIPKGFIKRSNLNKTTKKADIIAEINKARELDTTDNEENNQDDDTSNDTNIDVSTDNKDNEESEVTDEEAKEQNKSADEVNMKIKEDIEIPKGFVKKSNLNKKEYGYYNGRKYKKMKNGYGMWADNGQSFLLSELK